MLPDRYDDGGFSGGSMQRPGRRQLLADIDAGRIDVVVVGALVGFDITSLSRGLDLPPSWAEQRSWIG